MKTAEFEDPQFKKAICPGSFDGLHLNVVTEKTRLEPMRKGVSGPKRSKDVRFVLMAQRKGEEDLNDFHFPTP